MLADVFLYGRTRTYDYFDMYLPAWIETGSEEYREYRKNVSYLMKIRDILPENKLHILEKTGQSYVFIYGRTVSMLARFCHICGNDEFGRPICSTEGFIVRNSDSDVFRSYLADMISFLDSSEKSYYELYVSDCPESGKPSAESRTQEIIRCAYPFVKLGQFTEMKNAVEKSQMPFSFAFGNFERSLYDYSSDDGTVKMSAFFVSDECTEFSFNEKTVCKADFGSLQKYVMITRTQQGKIKYKLVLCREDTEKRTDCIAYESYEREAGSEIKLSELFNMHSALNEYIVHNGLNEMSKRKCVPYSSETTENYTGRNSRIVYSPPAQQKRSILQILKGERGFDFSEYLYFDKENDSEKLSGISETVRLEDDSSSRLVSYEKLAEADV